MATRFRATRSDAQNELEVFPLRLATELEVFPLKLATELEVLLLRWLLDSAGRLARRAQQG